MSFRNKLYQIIFEAETVEGKLFDVILLWSIIFSVIIVCLESVKAYKLTYGNVFFYLEWIFTILFSIEYIIRIYAVEKPLKYIFSFYGLVDLFSIVPSFFSLYFHGAQSLLVIRAIRLLRVFRLFKLTRFMGESDVLFKALKSSRFKITVFLICVMTIALTSGALMYLIEGPESSFSSIPKGVYWSIVTMTTVGYGDIVPQTDLGKALASFLMIAGYGIIAVPTGIVSVEIAKVSNAQNTRTCKNCLIEGHRNEAKYCWSCGAKLA